MQRRHLLLAAATGALTAIRREAWGQAPLRAGIVGCGRFGMVLARHLLAVGQARVVGLCDPDGKLLEAGATEITGLQKERPETFADFRQLLRPGHLDVAVIATPDHWHALQTIAALQAGADVYLEKPVSHTFLEGEAMVKAARKHNRVVQVGLQRRSEPHIKQAREILKEGKLGRVASVRAYYHRARNDPQALPAPVPPHLDWELWCGPAPLRPYSPALHPSRWRRFTEYGNGTIGDMGVHLLDLVRWYLDLGLPRRIFSSGGIFVHGASQANVPDTQSVVFDYPDLTVLWEHRQWGPPENPDDDWGITFAGDKGVLKVNTSRWELRSTDKAVPPQRVEAAGSTRADKTGKGTPGGAHMEDFLTAVRARARAPVDIEDGHLSTTLCLLANVSLKLGRPVTWDAKKQRPVADPAATKLLARPYRRPWKYPAA